jgi:hypothetical protein
MRIYEDRLESSWTHLITPSRNFVEVRWRSLFRSTFLGKWCTSYNAPPTSRKRAADRWSLRNFLPRSSLFMAGKAQKLHGARSVLYGGCYNGVSPIHFFQEEYRIQFRSRPMPFLGISDHEKGAPRLEISKWSTACSTFSRSGWSIVRSESLAKGGTSKKRPSPHLHKVLTRINKVSPRTLQTAHFTEYTNKLQPWASKLQIYWKSVGMQMSHTTPTESCEFIGNSPLIVCVILSVANTLCCTIVEKFLTCLTTKIFIIWHNNWKPTSVAS